MLKRTQLKGLSRLCLANPSIFRAEPSPDEGPDMILEPVRARSLPVTKAKAACLGNLLRLMDAEGNAFGRAVNFNAGGVGKPSAEAG